VNIAGKPVRTADRRRAAKLFLEASKLYQKERFLDAQKAYDEAARLDPENRDYPLAAQVARSHAVQALIQAAAKARLKNDSAQSRAAIEQGLRLEPDNPTLRQHLNELGDAAIAGQPSPLYEAGASMALATPKLAMHDSTQSFHIRQAQRQAIQQIFRAYGLEATVDSSVSSQQVRIDLDNVSFEKATQVLAMLTHTFYVPLDERRVLVARDTRENRQNFQRQEMETIYLASLTQNEMQEIGNLAKNVFEITQSSVEPSAGTITVRAPERNLEAFNATLRQLLDGHSQVMLDVQLIQLARTRSRDTGVVPPQTMTAFNLYSEANSILSSNQTLVNEIVSEGLASSGDTLAILMILIESGAVSSDLFSNGLAIFGGGITMTALQFGSTTTNISLNSSQTRALENIQLHLGDGESATLRSGSRYPIQTSSYSSLGSNSTLSGITSSGTSSSLSSLLSSYSSSYNVPMVEYQDLGLTLKATPNVLRGDLVALNIDMKIDALSGSSLNGNPILNSRAYSGLVTLKPGEAAVVISELDKTESRAISGVPGLSEIPGLNNMTGKDVETDYASLLLIMTPHVIRGIQNSGHSPIYRIERNQATH
jgi:type II secretory pathway component GspD/PulD (secretin)